MELAFRQLRVTARYISIGVSLSGGCQIQIGVDLKADMDGEVGP